MYLISSYRFQVLFNRSSNAIKLDLAGSSLTKRMAEARKNGLVFHRVFCSFFVVVVVVSLCL